MQHKTKSRSKYRGNTLNRASTSWNGAFKILSLLARAEHTENVSSVIANNTAVEIMSLKLGNF